jgi:acyl-CoA synthetase (AMP-forming)/AMP-acid ligase II
MAFSARNNVFLMSGTKLKEVDGPEVPTSFILIVPLFHVTGCVPVMLSCFVAGLKLAISKSPTLLVYQHKAGTW